MAAEHTKTIELIQWVFDQEPGNLESKRSDGFTPLLSAVNACNVIACRLLIGKGANLGAKDDCRFNCLHIVASSPKADSDLLQSILDAAVPKILSLGETELVNGMTPLRLAQAQRIKNIPRVRLLIGKAVVLKKGKEAEKAVELKVADAAAKAKVKAKKRANSAKPVKKACCGCGIEETSEGQLLLCECKDASFCSKECLSANYSKHKKACVKRRKELKTCDNCGNTDASAKKHPCECKQKRYCGKLCQVAHWKLCHEVECTM